MARFYYFLQDIPYYLGDLLEMLLELGVYFMVFLVVLCFAVAIVVKIGNVFKNEKKAEGTFWSNLSFWKWLSHGIDLTIITLLGILIVESPYDLLEFGICFAIVVGLRVLLYFAMKAEKGKK